MKVTTRVFVIIRFFFLPIALAIFTFTPVSAEQYNLTQQEITQAERLAEQGDQAAQAILAEMYYKRAYNRDSIQENLTMEERLSRALQRSPAEVDEFLRSHQRDLTEAKKWYLELAKSGHAGAQSQLGVIYPTEGDYDAALKWYRLSAAQGNGVAQLNIGGMYAKGEGVERNYEEAIKWWLLSAKQGDSDAQYNLGLAHLKGEGVSANKVAGRKWMTAAAAQGNAKAQYDLAVTYVIGSDSDWRKARDLFRQAEALGHPEAQEAADHLSHLIRKRWQHIMTGALVILIVIFFLFRRYRGSSSIV